MPNPTTPRVDNPSAPATLPTPGGNDQAAIAKTDDVVDAKRGSYTVAKGRTVDGKLPGETVELVEADAKRFLLLGFILDQDGAIVVRADGPAVNVVDGVQVKQSI